MRFALPSFYLVGARLRRRLWPRSHARGWRDGLQLSVAAGLCYNRITESWGLTVKLLMFGAKRFHYRAFEKTLPSAPDSQADEDVRDAAIIFIHAEQRDEGENSRRVFTKALKNVKWLANKQGLRNIVLHSFTHLGGDSASPEYAQGFIGDLAERLRNTDYQVWVTPFGYLCEWNLSVYGRSIARVFKQL